MDSRLGLSEQPQNNIRSAPAALRGHVGPAERGNLGQYLQPAGPQATAAGSPPTKESSARGKLSRLCHHTAASRCPWSEWVDAMALWWKSLISLSYAWAVTGKKQRNPQLTSPSQSYTGASKWKEQICIWNTVVQKSGTCKFSGPDSA